MSRPWFWTEWGRERWQQNQIEDLQYSVSSAYGEASRLRSQLARVQGSIDTKVNRLTAAFEAFVELSDIRADMAVYADAAMARHQVRLMLGAIGAGHPPEPPELPEVLGYWLVPAARSLYARLTGEPTRAARYAEAATELDGARARYFLTAAARLAGPVDLTAVELAALVPAAGRAEADHAQRAFWLAAAAGAFGDAGRALLGSTLAGCLGEAPSGGLDGTDPWQASVDRLARDPADVLAALRKQCEAPDDPPPVAEHDPALEPLAELVASLVDEGHEPERGLLRRIEQLRGTVELGTPPPEYRSWDAPAGTVTELVHADVFGTDTPPGARAVAVRAAAGWLRAAATTVADRGRAAAPDSGTIRIRGREIPLTAAGPDPDALDALRRQITDAYRPSRARQYVGMAVAGVGLVATVLGFAGVSVALGVLGVITLVIGGIVAITGARIAASQFAYIKQERASLDTAAQRAIKDLHAAGQRAESQRDRVTAELAALSETLGAA